MNDVRAFAAELERRRLAGGARLGGDYGYANVDSYFRGRTWHYHWPRPRGATPEPQAPPCAEQVVRSRACLSHIYRADDIPLTPGVNALLPVPPNKVYGTIAGGGGRLTTER